MSLRVTFDLEDKDLKFFRDVMRKAQDASKQLPESEIVAKAAAAVQHTKSSGVPTFVRQRLDQLEMLVAMLQDSEWNLQAKERQNVVTALSYFANPEDLIPDTVPVLGYIDDAIMIELVVKELKPELEAFADFTSYRKSLSVRNLRSDVSREEWVEEKRRALFARMRRRRSTIGSRGTGRRFRLF